MAVIDNKDKEENKKKSITSRFSGWLKSLFRKDATKDSDGEDANPTGKDRLKELTDRIDQSDKPVKLSSIPEEIRADFHVHIRNMAIAGFNDGVTGVRSDAHQKIAADKADEFYREFSAHSEGKLETLKNEINSKEKVVNSKWQQATLHHSYQNYIQHHHKFNERGNTVLEMVLYFVLFIIIFLADIPLAVEMIKRLFPTFMNNRAFSWSTIGENWEAFLTAIGIAASTIYIKIWYDEFVGKKFGHEVISQKKFIELFSENGRKNEELTEDEKMMITKHEKQVKVIKSVILCFTLVTITILGIFRMYAWMKIQRDIHRIPAPVLTLAFVFLTLLFSTISGVCLSVALNTWNNFKRLRSCKKENAELEKEYLTESRELAALQGEHAKVTANIGQWGDREAWVNKVKELLGAYYDMGFNEGLSDPGYFLKHLDFFGRVIYWRETAVSRRINKNINLLNTQK